MFTTLHNICEPRIFRPCSKEVIKFQTKYTKRRNRANYRLLRSRLKNTRMYVDAGRHKILVAGMKRYHSSLPFESFTFCQLEICLSRKREERVRCFKNKNKLQSWITVNDSGSRKCTEVAVETSGNEETKAKNKTWTRLSVYPALRIQYTCLLFRIVDSSVTLLCSCF